MVKNYHISFILFTKPAKDKTVYFLISYENICLTYTDKKRQKEPHISRRRVYRGLKGVNV